MLKHPDVSCLCVREFIFPFCVLFFCEANFFLNLLRMPLMFLKFISPLVFLVHYF